MRYKALATDYDGTLAHHGLVDPATIDAVTSLREQGTKVLLVTGREFPELLRERGVKELSVGRTIVATMETYVSVVNETIEELRLNAEVILNKGSLMVLPKKIDKGSG